jgi:hypothetical protein
MEPIPNRCRFGVDKIIHHYDVRCRWVVVRSEGRISSCDPHAPDPPPALNTTPRNEYVRYRYRQAH